VKDEHPGFKIMKTPFSKQKPNNREKEVHNLSFPIALTLFLPFPEARHLLDFRVPWRTQTVFSTFSK
jgi:hypothetical protein